MKYFFILIIYFNIFSCRSIDLTRQNPIVQKVLLTGKKGVFHFYEPNIITFMTGKLYKLIIKNESDSKHYFTSNSFANSIFTRKIQIYKSDEKIAEIKGVINEVEIWPNQQIEWWFVPVKAGVFDDLFCKLKDEITNQKHSDMGMVGSIIIK